jgi:hypothetical protein
VGRGSFPRLVKRLRAVITRQLSEDELAYIDQFYAAFEQAWDAATVRDRNVAARRADATPRPRPRGRSRRLVDATVFRTLLRG